MKDYHNQSSEEKKGQAEKPLFHLESELIPLPLSHSLSLSLSHVCVCVCGVFVCVCISNSSYCISEEIPGDILYIYLKEVLFFLAWEEEKEDKV
jgi:hypothetical protein